MAKQKDVKTNAMRILDSLKIPYEHYTYECDEFIDGIQIADKLSLPHEKVYKTLVTVGNSKNYFVFVIPIEAELDLKAAAKSVGGKERGNDSCKGYQCYYRLYQGRLYSNRHEEAVCNENRQFRREAGNHDCQRRADWLPAGTDTGKSSEGGEGGVCGNYQKIGVSART